MSIAFPGHSEEYDFATLEPTHTAGHPPVAPPPQPSSSQRLRRQTSHLSEKFKRTNVASAQRKRRKSPSRILAWHKGRVIGRGGFGTVYVGLDANSGQLVAGKEFNFDINEAKQVELLSILEKEIATMKQLSHPNIVKYIGADRVDSNFYIFMEYVPGGSLRSLLDEFGALPPALVSGFTRQILLGLEYLHENQVIHRDIKAANVLVNIDGILKLADFGSAQSFAEGSGMQGTPYWMAPEVIRGELVGWQADIWSLGCVVVEMITGQRPFSQFDNPVKALNVIVSSAEPIPLPECDRNAKDFLALCFHRDPHERPNATELLGHPFVAAAFALDASILSGVGSTTSERAMSVTEAQNIQSPVEEPIISRKQSDSAAAAALDRPAAPAVFAMSNTGAGSSGRANSGLREEIRSSLLRRAGMPTPSSSLAASRNPFRASSSDAAGHAGDTPAQLIALEEQQRHNNDPAAILNEGGPGGKAPMMDEVYLVAIGDDEDADDSNTIADESSSAPVAAQESRLAEEEEDSEEDSCTAQRKAQVAVLVVLVVALAVISSLLALKS